MARASTDTIIPLDRIAVHLQIDPYHFNGITSQTRRNAKYCDDIWYQHDFQSSGKLSREGLALALRQAEDVTITHLKYFPLPQWVEEEVVLPTHYRTELYSLRNAQARAKSLTASHGYVQEVGRKTSTYIDTPATVFSDPNGDGFNELITITFATSVTEEEELHVYYPSKDGRDEWEIRPLTSIAIAGGVATITFQKYLIPLENLVEEVPSFDDPHIQIDGDDDTNFLQTVDVYRVYSDPAQQVTFYSDPSYDCATPPCDPSTLTGCLFVRDKRRGILAYQPATYDEDSAAYTSANFTFVPQKAIIYYKAGLKDDRQKYPEVMMDTALERMIAFYALSLLDTELCGCDNTREIWQYMTLDRARISREESYNILWNDLSNPLGTTTAALLLWKHIQYINLKI